MSSRSRDGHVMGLSPAEVSVLMLSALRPIMASDEMHFTRLMLKDHYLKAGVPQAVVGALVHATCRVPGVKPVPGQRGWYRLPPHPEVAIRHRHWRMTLRRVDLDDARRLRMILEQAKEGGIPLTPGLEKIYSQLKKGIRGLK